jgi:hypothetical protein
VPAGTEAFWYPDRRQVRCVYCGSVPESAAGASARRERFHRRNSRFGGLAFRFIGPPQHDVAWERGAEGEASNAERLEQRLAGTGVRLLHDRAIPGRTMNIDHIAIGPGGITVIDSKNLVGKVRVDWSGGLFSERRYDLYVNGRRRTQLVEKVERQVEVVARIVAEAGMDVGSIAGALCFADVQGLPLFRQLRIRDVVIDGPRGVAKLAAREGPRDEDQMDVLLGVVVANLPPA